MEHKSAGPHAATPGDMALRGLRLVIVSESGRDRAFDEARLKRLTGGDLINGARALPEAAVSFQPSHLPLFITNHLPKVSADDEAVWARLRVVPFDVVHSRGRAGRAPSREARGRGRRDPGLGGRRLEGLRRARRAPRRAARRAGRHRRIPRRLRRRRPIPR